MEGGRREGGAEDVGGHRMEASAMAVRLPVMAGIFGIGKHLYSGPPSPLHFPLPLTFSGTCCALAARAWTHCWTATLPRASCICAASSAAPPGPCRPSSPVSWRGSPRGSRHRANASYEISRRRVNLMRCTPKASDDGRGGGLQAWSSASRRLWCADTRQQTAGVQQLSAQPGALVMCLWICLLY